jgi:hypothetical protein
VSWILQGTGCVLDGGEVVELWRYPFKSMAGEQLPAAVVSPSGIIGDRCWAVRDEVLGGIRGAKKFPELMRCQAHFVREPSGPGDSGDVAVTIPNGETVRTTDPAAEATQSSALGHTVSVWPLQPERNLEHYRLGQPSTQTTHAPKLATRSRWRTTNPSPTSAVCPASYVTRSTRTHRCPAPTSTPFRSSC